MKVALVHDYLREFGGAERVLEALHEIFPEAPVYVAYYNPKALGDGAKRFSDWDIRTSFIQKLPFANKLLSFYRLFAPSAFESFDLKEFDLVISSCNIYFSKAVITKPETLHISYIHSPPRYLYGYTTSFNYKKRWWTRIGAEVLNHILRLYDFETSQRPDILIANSKNVKERIKKFYRRDAEVIYPPVDLEEFKNVIPDSDRGSNNIMDSRRSLPCTPIQGGNDKDYFLSLSRLWKGKGVDIIVKAVVLSNAPLKVAGTGPEMENLKRLASGKTNIEFLGNVSDGERVKLYKQAKALIVASEDEDFGITAVESQAAGTPVIAIKSGGYLESVVRGKTGEFFDKNTPEGLAEVLKAFDPNKYDSKDCLKNAEKFSKDQFKKEILRLIKENS